MLSYSDMSVVKSGLIPAEPIVVLSYVFYFLPTIAKLGLFVARWVAQTFHNSFVQVQNILGQNRMLVNETNWNYESKVPDNLSKNVGLIRELNNTVRRVVDLIPVDSLIEEVPTVELLICSEL
ncbi:unnamed protein product [Lupinus luteus]|uniref:Protein EARLY FLOWERING 4 domain-containing protein n=1 Tax=Lupinus luteus TaxID=3873 RepID=A0AAV1XYJ4_LUPLU